MRNANFSVILPLLFMSLSVAGCGSESPSAPSSLAAPVANGVLGSEPAPTQSVQKFEIDFLMDMIDHHQMGVMMAEVCLQKAVHPELRTLCQNIIATQTAEIQQMQSWLSTWYGLTHEPEMKPGDMKMMDRLSALSGADFEMTFMEMMIRHHRKAVTEARLCERRAWHQELHALCSSIIQKQSSEIALMESWLCQWYGRCGGVGSV